MKRYIKSVYEEQKHENFIIQRKTKKDIILRSNGIEKIPCIQKITKNHQYQKVIDIQRESGIMDFAIERECDGSQFVWVPVGYLDNNGTLSLQFESVKKYGGVYISRYCMSKNKKTGKVQSVKGEKPLLYISFNNTMKFAMAFESKNTLMSHLP